MNNLESTGVILLAAGMSGRLGQPKQLVQFEGKSLLQNIIDEANQLNFSLKVIVSGGNSEIIFSQTQLKNFTRIANPNWQEGIGSSIRTGVGYALEKAPELEQLLFLVADQPLVTRASLEKLCSVHLENGKGITASGYDASIGVPAIFSRRYFEKLLESKGDQGAKKIIRNAMNDAHVVDFPEGALDIDTPSDLQQLAGLNRTRP